MLDTETKRKIDTARNILLGKVPDPKSQVEQITIALIYKFMDDMDAESEELGGRRKFFAGKFEQYGWAKLMRHGLGGYEALNLYAEAIERIPENPGVPMLFRDIFKNAYLPYNVPEKLREFLKVIDQFNYDHSERLGDAFEYLLSVMSAQGDAGQFRTPRHIIDFIVEIIDPKKNESVLDPACGTAGFLISSYKHIMKANSDKHGNSTLTPDERGALDFVGYDISPDMVRLSLVNMYLHGFAAPQIHEYDTLTSQDRWNEYYDVILANPPFMSPKGGIRPHGRFSLQSKRSEVLFVDYIAEHLTSTGRAGIIVPEGIIFQTGRAYKALRKKLVEDYLVGVISLPAGVFQPYSGVKTSILILDKELKQKSDSIFFAKVENDGFNLGAQRRPQEANDLPRVLSEISEYTDAIRISGSVAALQSTEALVVPKRRITTSSDYNLSAERYRDSTLLAYSKWPLIPIGELCVVERGASPRPIRDYVTTDENGVNWIKIGDAALGSKYITQTKEKIKPEGVEKSRRVKPGDFVLSNSMSFGRPYIMATDGCIHDGWLLLRDYSERLDSDYLYNILGSAPVFVQFRQFATGGVVNNLNSEIVRGVKIPLPPIEVQQGIVEELEGYQKIIDGCRQVVENYKPTIDIDPSWEMVELGNKDIFEVVSGGTPKTSEETYWNGDISWVALVDLPKSNLITDIGFSKRTITDLGLKNSSAKMIPVNSVIVSTRATIGRVGINRIPLATNQDFSSIVIKDTQKASTEFVAYMLTKLTEAMVNLASGGVFKGISKANFEEILIPLPPIEVQQEIVSKVLVEKRLVDGNKALIEVYTQKIQERISKVWGE